MGKGRGVWQEALTRKTKEIFRRKLIISCFFLATGIHLELGRELGREVRDAPHLWLTLPLPILPTWPSALPR